MKVWAINFLHNIRECDAIVHVVRAFENSKILRHDEAPIDPKKDIDIINTELILADLQTLEKRLPQLQKEAKANPKARQKVEYLQSLIDNLQKGVPISALSDVDFEAISDLHLLTAKPVIYAFNVDEEGLNNSDLQKSIDQTRKSRKNRLCLRKTGRRIEKAYLKMTPKSY